METDRKFSLAMATAAWLKKIFLAKAGKNPTAALEVGALALRVRSVPREGACASAGVQGAFVSECGCEAG